MDAHHKPHDTLFRAVFSQEDSARDLILSVLPEEILGMLDLRALKVENTSMIDNKLLSVPLDEERKTFLKKLLEYIIYGSKDIDEQEVEQVLRRVDTGEAREVYMTVAEQLIERGKREGKREGEREGKLNEKREVLLKLLSQKFDGVAEADKKKILETRDPNRLDQAIGLILKAESSNKVLQPLD
ncbi:MAG: Rpn family recombination-promoting nuclease/putative transposase [Spirochaetaceae bacterium]|nr:MAG: Rpn family recombination-promoting nuclease/putative transposase [Spirochaetaceae bacterium]